MSNAAEKLPEETKTTVEETEVSTADLFEEFASAKTDNNETGESSQQESEITVQNPGGEQLHEEVADQPSATQTLPEVANPVDDSAKTSVGQGNKEAGLHSEATILNNASPEMQALFSQKIEALAEMTNRAKSDSSRVSGLHKKINRMEAATVEKAMSPKEFVNSFKSKESWNRFVEENPDSAEIFGEFMQGMTQNADAHLAQSQATANELIEAKNVVETEAARIEIGKQFPEWEQWTKSGEFYSWLDKQPAIIRGMLEDESVEDSVTLLTLFQNHRIAQQTVQTKIETSPSTKLQQQIPATQVEKLKQKRTKQLEDGLQTPSTGGSVKPIPEGSTSELFDFFAEKKAKKRRENKARGF